ncbi:MAG TPA: methyltransferase domain-containing protein [Longimicrobiaceae bacterium]
MSKTAARITDESVMERLGDDLTVTDREYVGYHVTRYAYTLRLVGEYLDRIGASPARPARVLDISPHFLTRLTHAFFGDRVVLDTLGWPDFRICPPELVNRHVQFDLNDADVPERWPEFEEHDLVLMSEVIEHLYTAPRQVLAFLRNFVKPGGYLIVQTPNAVAIRSRLLMLAGKHPFDHINEDRTQPAHFREYTLPELRRFGEAAGFRVDAGLHVDYFRSNRVLKLVALLSPTLRKGLTVVLQREA